MNAYKLRKQLLPLCAAAVLGMELSLLVDVIVVCLGKTTSVALFAAMWAVLTATVAGLARWKTKQIVSAACAVPLILAALLSCGYLGWRTFSAYADYVFPDAGKHQIYGNRRVMLVVPHQDDDSNILNGVLEEYARYGSELYVVFVTNGDYVDWTETRYQEALTVFESLDVPSDHVIFLGYGDSWQEGGPHIYNAAPGMVVTSHAGRTETYGTRLQKAYREGRPYTIDNLMEDLKSVILEYHPDVLFCSDYDHHIDHRAVSLLFDKVMGILLKENPAYTPVVYKAYAYSTAWEADPDYYADNILSTQNPFVSPYKQKPAVYRWEDRVRFPVAGSLLSRSLLGSEGFERVNLYESQGTGVMAARMINGDKVAWQRQTASVCLHADITATSGQPERLNDFMLVDNADLVDGDHLPYDGVWTPDDHDQNRTVTVKLEKASDLATIVLYDHPSEEHNVLNAVIRFEDGTQIETGPLDAGGAATSIPVGREAVPSFEVVLMDTEGGEAGLSEIEAFAQTPRMDGRYIKLMDADGNFLYDYRTASDGNGELSVYTHGDLPEVTEENYAIHTDGDIGTAVWENGVIRVSCPAGESFVLNISCDGAGVSDNILVRNSGAVSRVWSDLWQTAEKAVYGFYSRLAYKDLILPSLLTKMEYVINHLL